MTDPRYVRAGDPIAPNLQANVWNEVLATVDDRLYSTRVSDPDIRQAREWPSNTAIVRNIGSDGDRGDIRVIKEPTVLPADSDYDFDFRMLFDVDDPGSGDVNEPICVLADAIEQNSQGLAVIGGFAAVRLELEFSGLWITRADVNTSDPTKLITHPAGTARIVWREDTMVQGTFRAIVRLGMPDNPTLNGIAQGTITRTTGGTMRVHYGLPPTATSYDIDVKLDWAHNNEDISSGKPMAAEWDPIGKGWRAIRADCE